MKKIVSAAVAATLLAGAAFAEVTLSTNYRLGTNLVTINPGEGSGAKDVQALNNLKSNWGDTTKIAAKGDNAGIELDLKTSESSISMDYGYAWLGFGDFKLYAGTKDTRGALKLVNPLDGNWVNNYCGYGKPGIHKDVVKKVSDTEKYYAGLDAANLTANQGGTKEVNFTAEYKVADGMFVRAALFDMHAKDYDKEASQEKLADKIRFGAQFDMKQDMFILNATFKYSKDDVTTADDNEMSFGIFVNPIVVDNLDMLFGFTYAKNEVIDKDNAFTGIDARFAYRADALQLYSLNNITLYDGDMISWHTLGAAYKVSDVITAAGAQVIINSTAVAWSDADVANKKSEYFTVRPYVDLTAQKNAVLSLGAELKFVNFMKASGEKTDFQFRVPVVMRVKL